jgi:hypothetical protein
MTAADLAVLLSILILLKKYCSTQEYGDAVRMQGMARQKPHKKSPNREAMEQVIYLGI